MQVLGTSIGHQTRNSNFAAQIFAQPHLAEIPVSIEAMQMDWICTGDAALFQYAQCVIVCFSDVQTYWFFQPEGEDELCPEDIVLNCAGNPVFRRIVEAYLSDAGHIWQSHENFKIVEQVLFLGQSQDFRRE